MLDLKLIEANPSDVENNLSKRGFDISILNQVHELNKSRKELIQIVESSKADVKKISAEVGKKKKAGEDASEEMAKVSSIKEKMSEFDQQLEDIKHQLDDILHTIPNLVSEDVPEGKTEDDNKLLKSWGEVKEFSFTPKDHSDLGEALGLLDFESGAKLTGARFVVLKGGLARLERALINFMLDKHLENGYEEIMPPYIVNDDTLRGTGQLPKFEDDLFKISDDEKSWYLIPTAEVPLTNLKKKELFPHSELPLKYTAYTPCFRSEAGSYGKDTRGLIRLHQFNKVELVNIVAADKSIEAHEAMIRSAESILEALNLPYRSMLLCGGDIGFSARRCIDIEVWLPGQGKYREISSISNCWDFQARRAGIRYRDENGKPQFAHTLNGSGLAVGRTLLAIMENYQNEDGSITVPGALHSYMGNITVIKSKN